MENSEVRSLAGGANQRGLRDHNGRLLLSLMLKCKEARSIRLLLWLLRTRSL